MVGSACIKKEVVCFWCGRYRVQIPCRSNLPHVANDSPQMQRSLLSFLMCGPWRKATELDTAHPWHVPKGY